MAYLDKGDLGQVVSPPALDFLSAALVICSGFEKKVFRRKDILDRARRQ